MPKFRRNLTRKEKEQEEKARERGNMVIVHGRNLDDVNDALRRLRKKIEVERTMED